MNSQRVVVFLDYQNVYRRARDCFHGTTEFHGHGQIDPLQLALAITRMGVGERTLSEVRVYRGLPDKKRDAKGHAATRRQVANWKHDSRVKVFTRPLRYPTDWPKVKEQEKGIDVALAIDFVRLAIEDRYDIGVLMSTDTDLKPALEVVTGLSGTKAKRAEVAAWSGPGRAHDRRLSISRARIWCHWLDQSVYDQVSDPTDFTLQQAARTPHP